VKLLAEYQTYEEALGGAAAPDCAVPAVRAALNDAGGFSAACLKDAELDPFLQCLANVIVDDKCALAAADPATAAPSAAPDATAAPSAFEDPTVEPSTAIAPDTARPTAKPTARATAAPGAATAGEQRALSCSCCSMFVLELCACSKLLHLLVCGSLTQACFSHYNTHMCKQVQAAAAVHTQLWQQQLQWW
jgi:hypothetical protein